MDNFYNHTKEIEEYKNELKKLIVMLKKLFYILYVLG